MVYGRLYPMARSITHPSLYEIGFRDCPACVALTSVRNVMLRCSTVSARVLVQGG